MKDFYKRLNYVKVASSCILLVLGLCLICVPNATLLTVCYLLGGFVLFAGIFAIINFFFYGNEPFGFIIGICAISIGGLIIGFAPQITSPQVFAVIVGVLMLISGLFKIQTSMDAKRIGLKYWWVYMLYSIALVILSIVLLSYPFEGQRLFLIFFGIVLLLDAIMKLGTMFVVKEKIKSKKIEEDENIIDI